MTRSFSSLMRISIASTSSLLMPTFTSCSSDQHEMNDCKKEYFDEITGDVLRESLTWKEVSYAQSEKRNRKNVKKGNVPGRLLFRWFSPRFLSARCASSPPGKKKKERLFKIKNGNLFVALFGFDRDGFWPETRTAQRKPHTSTKKSYKQMKFHPDSPCRRPGSWHLAEWRPAGHGALWSGPGTREASHPIYTWDKKGNDNERCKRMRTEGEKENAGN